MPNGVNAELEGTTFNVYSYVLKESKPVGPREVMRGANLSSKRGLQAPPKTRRFRLAGKERKRQIHNKREGKNQRIPLGRQNVSAEADILFPLFCRSTRHRNCQHRNSLFRLWAVS